MRKCLIAWMKNEMKSRILKKKQKIATMRINEFV